VKALAAALAFAAAASASAATFRVDDSLTLPHESSMAMRWRSLAPSRDAGHMVENAGTITIRLNVAPWLNKDAKIYMALPEQPIGQVSAEWTTQGKLLPGQLDSGNRTLVYSGPIRANMIEDTITLKISTDGRRLVAPQRLEFRFEIDVD
jgi:hypothetical protein